jgi:hypothetical protein
VTTHRFDPAIPDGCDPAAPSELGAYPAPVPHGQGLKPLFLTTPRYFVRTSGEEEPNLVFTQVLANPELLCDGYPTVLPTLRPGIPPVTPAFGSAQTYSLTATNRFRPISGRRDRSPDTPWSVPGTRRCSRLAHTHSPLPKHSQKVATRREAATPHLRQSFLPLGLKGEPEFIPSPNTHGLDSYTYLSFR